MAASILSNVDFRFQVYELCPPVLFAHNVGGFVSSYIQLDDEIQASTSMSCGITSLVLLQSPIITIPYHLNTLENANTAVNTSDATPIRFHKISVSAVSGLTPMKGLQIGGAGETDF